MSRNPDKSKKILIIFFASLTIVSLIGAGAFIYVQKAAIDKENQVNQLYINKLVESVAKDLADPDNCIATLQGRNLTKSRLEKIDVEGKAKYPVNTVLEDSQVKITEYVFDSSPADIAKSFSELEIKFNAPEGNKNYSEKIRLYVEVDQYDRVSYCNALSSTFPKESPKSNVSLRVKHVKHKGILAKFTENKTSIAAATCPEGYQMTGCNGSTNECPFEPVSPFKIEPQALNPNTCEVWINATEKCEVFAVATAICTKVIAQ